MFVVNEDYSIYATRGDIVFFTVRANDNGSPYTFQPGDVVRIKVFAKKDCEDVVLQKDFPVTKATEEVEITLTKDDTKFGGVISKPTDYWYEVELNPYDHPQTIIGYDEDGAKLFKLFPEGADVPDYVIDPEDIPVVDTELDMISTRPVQNQAIARAFTKLSADYNETKENVTGTLDGVVEDTALLKSRMDSFTALANGSTTGDAELIDARIDTNGMAHPNLGGAIRSQFNAKQDLFADFKHIELDIVEDTVYNVNSNTTMAFTYGQYAKYTLNGESVLKIGGYSHSSPDTYPAAAFFDADGNVIAKVGKSTASTVYEDLIVPVPSGAVSMVLNGKKWTGDVYAKNCIPKDLNALDLKANYISPEQFNGCTNVEERIFTVSLSSANTEILEATLYGGEGKLETGVVSETSVYDTIIYPITGIWKSVDLSNYPVGTLGGAFLDANKEWISSFSTAVANEEYKVLKEVPANAKYIAISKLSTNTYKDIYVHSVSYTFDGLMIPKEAVDGISTVHRGKKIVWLGTSVSFGQNAEKSYPDEAAQKMGFELVNCSLPGLAIHTKADGNMLQYGSFTLTKAEYEAQGWTIPDEPIPYTPGGSYNNYYRTYENVFCEENADADLYVFDVAPNNTNFDTKDWDAFDHANWEYKDGSDFADHRTTFLGALLFLMDKMYSLNENARMIFVLGSAFAYGEGKTAFQKVANTWNIPIINLWGKVNTSPKSLLKVKSKDGTDWHPSTFAHEVMGEMLVGELQTIA